VDVASRRPSAAQAISVSAPSTAANDAAMCRSWKPSMAAASCQAGRGTPDSRGDRLSMKARSSAVARRKVMVVMSFLYH